MEAYKTQLQIDKQKINYVANSRDKKIRLCFYCLFNNRDDKKSELKDNDNRSRSEVKLDVVVNMIESVSEDMVHFKEKVNRNFLLLKKNNARLLIERF